MRYSETEIMTIVCLVMIGLNVGCFRRMKPQMHGMH
jgi:hypothetical protein